MAVTTQNIKIDLSTGGVMPKAFTHQNDTARRFVFEVYNKGLSVDLSSYTAKFGFVSPKVNGQYTVISGSGMASGTISTNTVTVTLPSTYTAISGVGLLTMILTSSSTTIRPINIALVIQKSADGDDVVAGASDFPETLEEIAVDWLEENISIQIDDTLSVSGKAADAKVAGDLIENVVGIQIVDNWVDGHYYRLGTGYDSVVLDEPAENASYKCAYMQCEQGDVFHVSSKGLTGARNWAFIDSSYNVISRATASIVGSDYVADNFEITAPENTAYVVFNANNSYFCLVTKGVYSAFEDFLTVENASWE